ncbi:MAG: hypothetical protein WKF75_07315 [Singulisphaera sp.]
MASLRVHSEEDANLLDREEGLDPGRSRSWAEALKASAQGWGDPMSAWRRIADLGSEPTAEAVAARWREVEAEVEAEAVKDRATRREEDVELADFDGTGFRGWFVEDQAFGTAPLRPGAFLWNGSLRPVATFARGGAGHSGRLSRRLQGRCDRRRSRSTADTCTSWRRGGPRG